MTVHDDAATKPSTHNALAWTGAWSETACDARRKKNARSSRGERAKGEIAAEPFGADPTEFCAPKSTSWAPRCWPVPLGVHFAGDEGRLNAREPAPRTGESRRRRDDRQGPGAPPPRTGNITGGRHERASPRPHSARPVVLRVLGPGCKRCRRRWAQLHLHQLHLRQRPGTAELCLRPRLQQHAGWQAGLQQGGIDGDAASGPAGDPRHERRFRQRRAGVPWSLPRDAVLELQPRPALRRRHGRRGHRALDLEDHLQLHQDAAAPDRRGPATGTAGAATLHRLHPADHPRSSARRRAATAAEAPAEAEVPAARTTLVRDPAARHSPAARGRTVPRCRRPAAGPTIPTSTGS